MMKIEIMIHGLLHMFENHVLMLNKFYLEKFIVDYYPNTVVPCS